MATTHGTRELDAFHKACKPFIKGPGSTVTVEITSKPRVAQDYGITLRVFSAPLNVTRTLISNAGLAPRPLPGEGGAEPWGEAATISAHETVTRVRLMAQARNALVSCGLDLDALEAPDARGRPASWVLFLSFGARLWTARVVVTGAIEFSIEFDHRNACHQTIGGLLRMIASLSARDSCAPLDKHAALIVSGTVMSQKSDDAGYAMTGVAMGVPGSLPEAVAALPGIGDAMRAIFGPQSRLVVDKIQPDTGHSY